MVPDMSPPSRTLNSSKVCSYEEAHKVVRPRAGTWTPKASPTLRPQMSPIDKYWASPAPKRELPEFYFDETEPEFYLDEVEVPQASTNGGGVAIDNDGPKRRAEELIASPATPRGGTAQRDQLKFEVEQLIFSPGSLPRPMVRDQREAIIRRMMPTATHEMLAKVPAKLLDAQSDEAQALRRKLVDGATIVFISAGLQGKRFILERAAELGVKSVVLDHPGSWSERLVAEGIIAKFVPVDMTQSSDEIFQQALASIVALGADGTTGTVDGITTFLELSVPLVARLCEALGLPGLRPEAVDDARDKHRTRACLAAAGLPTPRNALIKAEADLAAAAEKVGFPAVMKPVSGAASLGVKKVESPEQLRHSYKEVNAELSSLVVSSGALIQGDGKANGVNADNLIDTTLILEQYLDGCEVDVDVVMSDGEWQYAGVADNGPTLEPYFNETWAVAPSLIAKDQQRELKQLAVSSVKALGFTAGVFHVECKYTSTGPQLIEVNARMGGGQVRQCNLMTWGVDLVEETLFIALGIPARPPVSKSPIRPVAYCYMNAKHSGTMGSVRCIEELGAQDDVIWAKPLVREGDTVVGPADGLPTWLCDLLVTKPTAKEALAFLQQIEETMPVQIV